MSSIGLIKVGAHRVRESDRPVRCAGLDIECYSMQQQQSKRRKEKAEGGRNRDRQKQRQRDISL